jgi:hypothetical protein
MLNKFRWVIWICGLILFGNFVILMAYGDTLQSTHLFIVRGTVFYPFAFANLTLGLILFFLLVSDLIKTRRK